MGGANLQQDRTCESVSRVSTDDGWIINNAWY
jgi:hypothetical protein